MSRAAAPLLALALFLGPFPGLLPAPPGAAPALAKEAAPMGEDPAVEARLMALASELRCLVCQNQTLADSHADLAVDFRREIREMIAKGMTDDEIVAFLVARYGDFIRYRPPWKATTVLLWLGPFLLVAVGGTVLGVTLKRRRARVDDAAPLSEEEERRVRRLLGEGKKDTG